MTMFVTERVLVTDGDGVPEFVPDGLLEALPDLEEEDARLGEFVTLREYVSDGVTLPDREELEHLELVGLVDVEGVIEVVTEGLLEALPDLDGVDV